MRIIPASFRQRILLGFSVLVLSFLGVTVTVETVGIPGTAIQGRFGEARAAATSDMELISALVTERIALWFKERRGDIKVMSSSPFLDAALETQHSESALRRLLESWRMSQSSMESMAIIDPVTGAVLGAGGGYAEAQQSGDIGISPERLARVSLPGFSETLRMHSRPDKKTWIQITRQVFSPRNPDQVRAILVVELMVDDTVLDLAWPLRESLNRNWTCLVASELSGVVIPFDRRFSRQDVTALTTAPQSILPIAQALAGVNAPFEGFNEHGQAVLGFHRHIKVDQGISLGMAFTMESSEMLDPVWDTLARSLMFWLVLFAAGIALAFWLSRQIAKPIKELADVAHRIESGDLSGRVSFTDQSEFGYLGRVFNAMAQRIETWQRHLEQQVSERTQDLQDSERRLQRSASDLADQNIELEQHRNHLEKLVEERTAALSVAKSDAEAANRAKSTFLANMSHELRTPLNAIIGFSQIMANEDGVSAGQKENLAIILKSGNHLLALINSVLDLAKIESGKVEIETEEIDLGNFTSDLIAMLKGRAEARGLQLFLDQSSSFPRFVKTDPAKLRQILINLVGNAIKFTEQGQVIVKLYVVALNEGNNQLRLAFEISDTGPGMTPEDAARVFHPFEQAVSKSLVEGTGLGLSIAREYVHLLGGDIAVRSALGQGTTFSFTILAETVAAEHVSMLHGDFGDIVRIDNAAACKILVVEDQLENRLLLREILARHGFQHREVDNGQEGVAAARDWRPDCILMDRRMPVMDGIEATRAIAQLGLTPPPVILAVTAHAFAEERAEMIAAGCADLLGKPFRDEDLCALLARYLPITVIRDCASEGLTTEPASMPLSNALVMLPATTLADLQKAVILCDTEQITSLLAAYPDTLVVLRPQLDAYEFGHIAEEIDKLTADTGMPAGG
ncbi:MAG: ATP-binding protein [Candidatus Competibacter phosphatis]